jgi:hypothetical protein
MSKLNLALALNLTTALALAQQIPQDSSAPTFRSQSDLVMVPFHVTRGDLYVQGLKAGDVVLLEDGHPRDFSIFEGPDTQNRTPVELVLLFDTTIKPWGWSTIAEFSGGGRYSLKDDFTIGWEEAVTRAVVAGGGPDVRISVYRFDLMQLERLCKPTRDPKELIGAVQALRTPMPYYTSRMTASQREELRIEDESTLGHMHALIDKPISSWGWPGFERAPDSGGEYIPLELPPNRKNRPSGPAGNAYREWPLEAAIGALKDSAASPVRVLRMTIMFSTGASGTTTIPEDVAQQAVTLGIPIYPVLTHSKMVPEMWRTRGPYDLFEERLGRLGKLTGGRSIVPSPEENDGALTASELSKILAGVRNEAVSQYTVGFVPPPSSGTPREHKLEIKLASKSSGQLIGGKRQTIY